MEETLGKRISFHRKRLGLTQDQLAERIGVTAQAVSKWENNQSCPDITTLPRLAEIFDTTTDALLGVVTRRTAEITAVAETEQPEPEEGPRMEFTLEDEKKDRQFSFYYDAGRKGGIGLAVWVLATAAMLFLSESFYGGAYKIWDCLWPTGLLVFGLFGLYPRFSVFRLGCALLGGYAAANLFLGVVVNRGLWLPIFLLLFGLSLLVDALRKNNRAGVHSHGSKEKRVNSSFDSTDDSFACSTSFGESHHRIPCTRLSHGDAEVSFGELTVDLCGCEAFAPECSIDLNCSFGALRVLVPGSCRVVHMEDKAFADVEITGYPAPDAASTIRLNCDVSFGQISIVYV